MISEKEYAASLTLEEKAEAISWAKERRTRAYQGFGRTLYSLGFRFKVSLSEDLLDGWVGVTDIAKSWEEPPHFGNIEVSYDIRKKEGSITVEGDDATLRTVVHNLEEQGYHFDYFLNDDSATIFIRDLKTKNRLLSKKGMTRFLQKYHQIVRDELRLQRIERSGRAFAPLEICVGDKKMKGIFNPCDMGCSTIENVVLYVPLVRRPRNVAFSKALPDVIREAAQQYEPLPDRYFIGKGMRYDRWHHGINVPVNFFTDKKT